MSLAAAAAAAGRQLGGRAAAQLRGLAAKADALASAPSAPPPAADAPAAGADAPTTTLPGQAFLGDLRSTSGLGLGDGLRTHTSKWLAPGAGPSPLDYCQAAEPVAVHGTVVASRGADDPALGCPVEYINLKGTSRDNPAVCKYTGMKYYSVDWQTGGH